MTKEKRGQNLDLLVHNGGVTIFRCRRDRRVYRAFFIFVLVAIATGAALAFLS
jgi:hypothetical protein